MSSGWSWTCPFCSRPQIVTASNSSSEEAFLFSGESKHGQVAVRISSISCSNADCRELHVVCNLHKARHTQRGVTLDDESICTVGRLPSSFALIQPKYIPAPLRNDYNEACSIAYLSPKASATLARRCIQGIIRDFCNIRKERLVDEIKELRKQANSGNAPRGVELDVIDAIDAVRSIGNIGAHMEKDINVIVDVDPEEAQILLQLVELLFKEWYVARHDRAKRISDIKAIAEVKAAQKALPPPES